MTEDGRHLTISTVDHFWNSGIAIEIPLNGTPICRLRLDPEHAAMQLITVYERPEPNVSELEHVSFGASVVDGETFGELSIDVEENVHGAYGLLATVADEIQVAQAPLAAAVATAITRHRNIFAARTTFTTEKEIGLYGELLFLEYLIGAIETGAAVASWQGPLSEEHDYVFDMMHFEVKTTTAERRRHVIHGLTQLVPIRAVPLSVLSIQLTRTSESTGRTLPRLVSDVRELAGGYVVELDRRLAAHNWEPSDADLYRTAWTHRSRPRAYRVEGDFPAMTPALLGPTVPSFGLISDVLYRIDLTDRAPSDVPSAITSFVETP